MAATHISVRGARTHNLKNINLDIPRDTLTVITGLSGSGKSSLAFDTLYAEGQRRYVESLSAYARQFLSVMDKPDVDLIEGLSPTISIEQKSTSHNPRSTVGTTTEIYDYLRLLFARTGTPCCPDHGVELAARTVSEMVDATLTMEHQKDERMMLLAPVVRQQKGMHQHTLEELRARGFVRARIDGIVHDLDEPLELEKNLRHDIEVVVDRFRIRPDINQRLAESFETALQLTDGLALITPMDDKSESPPLLMSARFSCPLCDYSLGEMEPKLFSFNNPAGACTTCEGLGRKRYVDADKLVLDPNLTLQEGVIVGWGSNHSWHYHLISTAANHHDIPLDTPWGKLDKQQRHILLEGHSDPIKFVYRTERGRVFRRTRPFRGVLKTIERRYMSTESEAVRDELGRLMSYRNCESCEGTRLNRSARHVFVEGIPLPEITGWNISTAHEWSNALKLSGNKAQIGERILQEIRARLKFLCDVGLNYLTLDRSADTLSGGEAQRIRLASQVGTGLTGVIYVLDEPSIGLHQRDNGRLLDTLCRLRDLGNTVLVVEHDQEAIERADYVLDLGPGAGVRGGEICAQGKPSEIAKNKRSITGDYLSGRKCIALPEKRAQAMADKQLRLIGARGNNLKQVDLEIPVGLMTCVTGVSGSGKSTLVSQTLYPVAATRLNRAHRLDSAPFDQIEGLQHLDKVVNIDQSPIGRTPRSNPATYTGLFTPLRELFANTQEARARGYKPGRFSFNVRGGRCEACKGDGLIQVEMHFLADVHVICEQCNGARYNRETLEVLYRGFNIHQILDMTVSEALEQFTNIPSLERKLRTLVDVGLGYIKLGQSATTLSGGEAQRIKLSRELSRAATGKTLYILDEPTTGLHFQDIEMLLSVLHRLRDKGNTLIVIEHNLDVIKTADWIVDLGPEGGAGGGEILFTGTPEGLAGCAKSHTAKFLAPLLRSGATQPTAHLDASSSKTAAGTVQKAAGAVQKAAGASKKARTSTRRTGT